MQERRSNNNSIGILLFSFQCFISYSIFIIIKNFIVFKNIIIGIREKAFDLSTNLEIYTDIGGHKKFGCHTLCFYSNCLWALSVNRFSQLSEKTRQLFDLYAILQSSFFEKRRTVIFNIMTFTQNTIYTRTCGTKFRRTVQAWYRIPNNTLRA